MNISTVIFRFLLATGFGFTLAACSDDGLFEQAGERADEAVEGAQNHIENGCENVTEKRGTEDKDC
ncbi:hypothetical protein [Vibrio coralliilyticus]|uniref:Uncharacterized protein n=1 Tax=Vibrio coralliilyticus TaxID=190893 RepID=A0AAP6ZQ51_9VIBR|nr:hypothetical protein [Vibrio coralliilyticus]NOJ26089.1 hypothetical protein [Vibrio coralliilyticus]